MEKIDKRISKRLDELDTEALVLILQQWNLEEFTDFVRNKHLDGRKVLEVTEGLVKLWRPRANAKKFISFIEDLKLNPEKYLSDENKNGLKTVDQIDVKNVGFNDNDNFEDAISNFEMIELIDIEKEVTDIIEIKQKKSEVLYNADTEIVITKNATDIPSIESQYQTVKSKKSKEEPKDIKVINEEEVEIKDTSSLNTVEELLKKLVPAKSFLYRHHPKKIDKLPSYLPMDGTSKKTKKLFRLSSYEYPFFDLRSKFNRNDSTDRGYYCMKRNSIFYFKTKRPEARTKYKSLPTPEEVNIKYPEDHLYEDLNYNDVIKDTTISRRNSLSKQVVRPCIVKIQEFFNSFRIPFLKKNEEIKDVKEVEEKEVSTSIYENAESIANMYDSVRVNQGTGESKESQVKIPVEDYLEPVQVNKDYCDVNYRQKDESILGYIMSIFESRFGLRRETNDANQSEDSDNESNKVPQEAKWDRPRKTNMADRPLPIPVENEAYYMNIDRSEAENLLKGQPDGTFVLRPSSQPNHAYTLSVACSNAVHNVGIRRRPDGRLALGFARKGERSFTSITALLHHHKKRRLLLVAAGGIIGATTLNEAPQYYQTPSSLPVCSM
ncbi:hypothetical protein K1T71_013744 [Dendrolimus kikuchii]|uniref:Uncharacterized protein n=1 Tax=Dendrolimus kikuchii TaxID=765133 RepID=A0ACC1CHC5_9NEOP|nr:hypothetical protein K1T71_013744 [Dendrolimus kikuchii]